MKLRDYQPSSSLKVSMFATWKSNDCNYISYEEENPDFIDDGFLVLLKSTEGLLESLSLDIGENLNLDTEVSYLLNITKVRPVFYSVCNDGDDFGVREWCEDIITSGYLEENKFMFFEEECRYGDTKIGYLKWKNIDNFK